MQTPRLRSSLVLAAALAVFLPALGASAELKVGFVDKQRAVFSSTEGKEIEKSLSAFQEKKQAEMDPHIEDCKKKREELEAQRFVLSEEAMQERSLEVSRCSRELERDFQAARDEVTIEQQKRLAPIIKRFQDTIAEIGKKEGFDLILDKSSPGILYFQDALDITDLVVKRLNGK